MGDHDVARHLQVEKYMRTAVNDEAPLVRKERFSSRNLIKWLAIGLLLFVVAIFGYRYWHHGELYASTDNAYLNANTVEIAPQIGGEVISVHVRDNQQVKGGDPLFDIDPQPYRLALEKALA